MKAPNNDINSISPRANAKIVSVGERRFLVGKIHLNQAV